MGDMVNLRQSHEVMAKLGTKADWSRIPLEIAQAIIEDPSSGENFTRFLLNRGRAMIVTADGIIPPRGGKIHIASVSVNESRSWKNAVKAVGPDTGSDWDVWEVGDQYPPAAGATEGLQDVILVNFGKRMRSGDVLAWGKSQNLRPASPRTVFAIGYHCPNFHRDLGLDYMAVVSLVPCSFGGGRYVPRVWWAVSERDADLHRFDSGLNDYYWFAFVRE